MAEAIQQEQAERSQPHRKVLQGTVVSAKMQKTVVVAVENFKRHRLYKKTLRRTKRYKAHDEHNTCVLGDLVRIVETRPLSKEKRWRVAEIMVRGNVAEIQPQVIGAEIEGRVESEDADADDGDEE
jgi:small subunit ribosomal protein S17